MILAAAALIALFSGQTEMSGVAAAPVEGRPAARDLSPLQARIDAAEPGTTVVVEAGRYVGDLVIDKPLRLIGRGRPLLVGAVDGTVVRIRAADVTLEGFDIDGLGGGDLGRDASGVHVSAPRAIVRDCRISNTLFGVYLREAHGTLVERVVVRGIRGKDPGEKGSGIHVWNTTGFRLVDNDLADVRDGFYIQSSSHGDILRNTTRDMRYGLHYMFSDDNVFEENTFENGAAGAALMYSRRIAFRRNRFLHNRGFASVGLLLKACDDVVAEHNLIADNARGIFVEGSYRNRFTGNIVAESDVAIVLYDSAGQNRFEGNSFVGNLTPLSLVGRRTDTVFAGNYWSDHDDPDLDGDGVSDRPYRLSSVFDHLRSNLTAADLFTQGLVASAVGSAERAFPVLEAVAVEDARPLAFAPALPETPRATRGPRRVNGAGLTMSAAAMALSAWSLASARSRRSGA